MDDWSNVSAVTLGIVSRFISVNTIVTTTIANNAPAIATPINDNRRRAVSRRFSLESLTLSLLPRYA